MPILYGLACTAYGPENGPGVVVRLRLSSAIGRRRKPDVWVVQAQLGMRRIRMKQAAWEGGRLMWLYDDVVVLEASPDWVSAASLD